MATPRRRLGEQLASRYFEITGRLGGHPEVLAYILAAVFIVATAVVYIAKAGLPAFWPMLGLVVSTAAPIALLALAAGLTIAASQIDISTASLGTLAATLFALASQSSLLEKALFGLIILALPFVHWASAGLPIAHRRSPPLITTWALSLVYLVVASLVTLLATREPGSSIEGSISGLSIAGLSQLHWSEIGSGGVILIGLLGGAMSIIKLTQVDQMACAIGANKKSASYIGVEYKRTIPFIYFIAAILSCIGGVAFHLRGNTAEILGFEGYELIAVAVAVLGGTVMTGGYFRSTGVIAASFVYACALLLVQTAEMPFGGELESRLLNILFAAVLFAVGIIFGKLMSGDTDVIVIRNQK